MHFEKSDLQQLTPEYVGKLPSDRLVTLLHQLREDLLCAHDRLHQDSTNSSRPPSSQPLWSKSQKEKDAASDDGSSSSPRSGSDQDDVDPPPSHQGERNRQDPNAQAKRKPGKQPGAPGFGRTQKFVDVREEIHRPVHCKGCNHPFPSDAPFVATTGFETIDLVLPEPGKIGITGQCTKHVYGTIHCECGFDTVSKPHRCAPETGWSIDLGEWKLIGPMLLALIVFAKLRLHLTIDKTRALLSTWLGISLSEGTIGTALLEAGRAVSDLEPSILDALRKSGLIHIDETAWKERKVLRWLWVAVGSDAVHYTVGARTTEMAQGILGSFAGRIMSDGYGAYRSFQNRIRCWAHLNRKAKGLADSWDKAVALFGDMAVEALKALMEGVYRMRACFGDARAHQRQTAEDLEAKLCIELLRNQHSPHKPIFQFAGEILNDVQTIFAVLRNPDLPLTNNIAEQALRPMVIMRKISHGSKTPEGSRTVALLASVYDTLRVRRADVSLYISQVFKSRRSGRPSPPLPAPS